MSQATAPTLRPVDLSDNALQRFGQAVGRGALRRCPYCGGSDIFQGWFTLKERCPRCNTLFAYEDGYFLGSYVMNIGVTELLTLGIVIWMLVQSSLSVLQMQIIGVSFAVGLPIFFYPYALSLWMALDLLIHPPGDFSQRHRV